MTPPVPQRTPRDEPSGSERSDAIDHGLEGRIAGLLSVGTLLSVALLAIGGAILLLSGVRPLDPAPSFDLGQMLGDLVALRPIGLVWLGLVVVLVTPAARVATGLVGYARRGEAGMALVALLVLAVIGVGVVTGLLGA